MSLLRSSLLTVAGVAAVAAPIAGAQKDQRPERIPLPNGYQPEGIAPAGGSDVVVGSIPTGALYVASTRTGKGRPLFEGGEGRQAIGLERHGKRLYVAGGSTGKVRLHDLRTGRILREEQAGTQGSTFVNDVVVHKRTAYFTDSRAAKIYALPRKGAVRIIQLSGEFELDEDGFNLNGIEAKGRHLIAVQSATGRLIRIDPRTGATRIVDLGGAKLENGDGLWFRGRTLYVVQNRDNKIAVVRMAKDLLSGRVTGELTDPDFRVPTTIARVRGDLYAVNARFGTPPTPVTDYDVVRVDGS